MIMDINDHTLKTILVGDSRVGKTSFFNLLRNNTVAKTTTTIGVDYTKIFFIIDHKNVSMTIWDSAGQERFLTIVRSYFRNICGVILMFDVSDPPTFYNLERWLEVIEYEKTCHHTHPILLIGNKCDLPNRIDKHKLEAFIKKYNLFYKEYSCKHSYNLEETMMAFVKMILNTVDGHECSGINNPVANQKTVSLHNANRCGNGQNTTPCCTIS